MKKKIYICLLCFLIMATVAAQPIRAAKAYLTTGSFNLSPLMEAQLNRTKTEVVKYEIAKEQKKPPQTNAISLNVLEDNLVQGQGKVSEYGADWWIIWQGKITDYASDLFREQYWLAFNGARTGLELSGTVAVKASDGDIERKDWTAKQVGDQVQGEIINFWRGMNLEFSLQMDADAAPIELDSTVQTELLEELDKSGVIISGDPADREDWQTEVMGANNAYLIVDGERRPLTDDMLLEPGMEIETKGEDGLAVFTTSTGEYIRLQGNSKVTLMTTETVKDEQWKEILDQHTKKRPAGSISFDRNDPNRLKTRTPVTVMHAGQMVVKYESGSNKGWWNAAFRKDYDLESGVSAVGFAGGLNNDALTGKSVEAKPEPIDLIVENHSLVEYNYQGEILEIKVYQGEAIAYQIDLITGENKELFKINKGESLTINLSQYQQNQNLGLKKDFDLNQKSQAVIALEKQSAKLPGMLFGFSFLALIIILLFYLILIKLIKLKINKLIIGVLLILAFICLLLLIVSMVVNVSRR